MWYWVVAAVIGVALWSLETYLRKKDEAEQQKMRAAAIRAAEAAKKAAHPRVVRRQAVKRGVD